MNLHILDADDDGENTNDIFPVLATDRYEHNAEREWNNGSTGLTTKVPPMFDGRTSWFQYEELIDDWLDLTTLGPDKHGPALKNRLMGETAVYKSLIDRDVLKTKEGVRHFKDVLRPNFVKGTQSIFLWRFFQLVRTHRGNTDFVKWIGRFTVAQKRLVDSWMDLMPESNKQDPKYLADIATESLVQQNAHRPRR